MWEGSGFDGADLPEWPPFTGDPLPVQGLDSGESGIGPVDFDEHHRTEFWNNRSHRSAGVRPGMPPQTGRPWTSPSTQLLQHGLGHRDDLGEVVRCRVEEQLVPRSRRRPELPPSPRRHPY